MPLPRCEGLNLKIYSPTLTTSVFVNGPAWTFPNLSKMLGDIDRSDEDILIPRGADIPTPSWDIAEEYVLEGWIIGSSDPAGADQTDTLAGWMSNVAYLRTNLSNRLLSAPFTRTGVLTSGVTEFLSAEVKVGPLKTGDLLNNEVGGEDWQGYFSTATLRLKVFPPGWAAGS